ncbi:MAG: CDP-2,3-bis-(O-geranylgeranyl)-sn-glycerol synthase [Candidatus Anstonellales archaeon]
MIDFINTILYILPAYVANSSPVVLGGGDAIDRGAKIGNNRVLGKSKTIMGFFGGLFAGVLIAAILAYAVEIPFFPSRNYQLYGGIALSFGTVVGDLAGSFIKRRMGIEEGKPFILDQFAFLIVALLFAYPFTMIPFYSWDNLLYLAVLTYVLHIGSNIVANRLGIKKVPW